MVVIPLSSEFFDVRLGLTFEEVLKGGEVVSVEKTASAGTVDKTAFVDER